MAKAQTVEVPAGQGSVAAGPCAGHHVGTVSSGFWLNYLLGSVGNLSATSLTIFLAYDVGVAEPSGAVFPLQGHGTRLPSGPTFVVGSYGEDEVFQPDAPDILTLSKGLGAWIDDPQISNSVPAWGHIGVVKACYSRLEDALPAANSFSVIQSGFTHHVAKLTFLSWFARQNPSEAVNGWHSTRNSLAAPQPVCQRDLGEF